MMDLVLIVKFALINVESVIIGPITVLLVPILVEDLLLIVLVLAIKLINFPCLSVRNAQISVMVAQEILIIV